MESVEAECGNRDGSRGIRWVKKKREKSILCIREFIIDTRLFRNGLHTSYPTRLVEIRRTRAALLIKNYRPSNS